MDRQLSNLSKQASHDNRIADSKLYLAGFSSLWVMDRFFQIGRRNNPSGLGPAEDEMLEGFNLPNDKKRCPG